MYLPGAFHRDSAEVDWCEDNYVVSSSIAEFYNTMSSFVLVFYPIIMLSLCHRYTRFVTSKSHIAWYILIIIGVASVYYHATLSLVGQLLDEVAILWVLTYTTLLWLPERYYRILFKSRETFVAVCAAVGIGATILSPISPFVNAIALTMLGVPFAWLVIKEVIRYNIPIVNRLCKKTVICWILAVSVWTSDRVHCSTWQALSFPYLHSFWHILIAMAGHQVAVIGLFFHSLEQWTDLETELAYWPAGVPEWLAFPYVAVLGPKVSNNNNVTKYSHSKQMTNGVYTETSGGRKRN